MYEFGSFGLTGCHRRNLLADGDAAGCRLAFAQGGHLGFRLVMLTPPVDIRELAHVREALWSPATMPLRYEVAPLLIDNDGSTDVDGMNEFLHAVLRNTWREKFSSRFRSRKEPVEAALAAAIIGAWDGALAADAERAEVYWEALPYWDPDALDRDRHGTHQELLRSARGESSPPDDDDEGDVAAEAEEASLCSKCLPRRRALAKSSDACPRRC
jgi:hypothetical protein